MVVANVVVVVAGVVAVVVVTGVVGSDQIQKWIQLRVAIFWI